MTQEEYRSIYGIKQGKHCKKEYHVWVIDSVVGPQREYDIIGLDEARLSVEGAYDYEITRKCDGRVMR